MCVQAAQKTTPSKVEGSLWPRRPTKAQLSQRMTNQVGTSTLRTIVGGCSVTRWGTKMIFCSALVKFCHLFRNREPKIYSRSRSSASLFWVFFASSSLLGGFGMWACRDRCWLKNGLSLLQVAAEARFRELEEKKENWMAEADVSVLCFCEMKQLVSKPL